MNFEVDENRDWIDVPNLGMFTYVLSARKGKDKNTEAVIHKNIKEPLTGRPHWFMRWQVL